jgi:SAM-dependent methyltransferase
MGRTSDRWFAWLLRRVSTHHDLLLRERKRSLFGGLRGTIVEIGPGTGANLRYYARGVRWIGIEPNLYMHSTIDREAKALKMPIDLRGGSAEALHVESGSVDAVVSTLVLCSVKDPAACLREVLRVLKPEGKFVFIEHVAAGPRSGLHWVQRAITPLWSCVGGGCNPALPTAEYIRSAGFREVVLEEFRLPLGPVAPHIAGIAIR